MSSSIHGVGCACAEVSGSGRARPGRGQWGLWADDLLWLLILAALSGEPRRQEATVPVFQASLGDKHRLWAGLERTHNMQTPDRQRPFGRVFFGYKGHRLGSK